MSIVVFTITCPWCTWFGVTSGYGEDHGAYLKRDFITHVYADHSEHLIEARALVPERREKD